MYILGQSVNVSKTKLGLPMTKKQKTKKFGVVSNLPMVKKQEGINIYYVKKGTIVKRRQEIIEEVSPRRPLLKSIKMEISFHRSKMNEGISDSTVNKRKLGNFYTTKESLT